MTQYKRARNQSSKYIAQLVIEIIFVSVIISIRNIVHQSSSRIKNRTYIDWS